MKRFMCFLLYVLLTIVMINDVISNTLLVPQDYLLIQNAINASTPGDTVLVHPGIYYENLNISKNIVIGSLYLKTRDKAYIHQTVLNGNHSATVVFFDKVDTNTVLTGFTITNGYGMRDGGGIYCNNSHPYLENLIILQCSARRCGGGIAMSVSNPKLEDVFIYDNSSYSSGGGIYANGSSPELYNVKISYNRAGSPHMTCGGGGIYFWQSKAKLSKVTISKNWSQSKGGGLYFKKWQGTFDAIDRCNIYLNSGSNGADIYSADPIHVVVDTFTVKEPLANHASPIHNFSFDILHAYEQTNVTKLYVSPDGNNLNSGRSWSEPLKNIEFAKIYISDELKNPGTIYLAPGVYSPNTNGEVFELFWKSNINLVGSGADVTILDASKKSGIFNFKNVKNVTIKNLKIINGNGFFAGGSRVENSNVKLINVAIDECSGDYGGALWCDNSHLHLMNMVLSNNTARKSGGGIYSDQSYISLVNTTIVRNSCADVGGAIFSKNSGFYVLNSILWNDDPHEIYLCEENVFNHLHIAYSDIKGGYNGLFVNDNYNVTWERSNLDIDPLFKDPELNNFQLSNESYCIGTGSDSLRINEFTFYAPGYDCVNNMRPNPGNSNPDMGAYENHLAGPLSGLLLADFDVDLTKGRIPLTVHFTDFSRNSSEIISWNWDFDNDGITDSEEQNPVWIYENPGIYTVSLTVTDGNLTDSTIKHELINARDEGYIYISKQGADSSGTGSIDNPFRTIQRGIEIAFNGDKLLILPGIYYENIYVEAKNIVIGSLFLTTKDTTTISQTIIDGNQKGSVVTFEKCGTSTSLTGLKLINGSALKGGGICCSHSNPQINNIIVSKNQAKYGGGLSCFLSSPHMENVTFVDNSAIQSGGAIHCENKSSPTMNLVDIINNSAASMGGGVSCEEFSNPVFHNVVISKNRSRFFYGGGIYCNKSNPTLQNVILFENDSPWGGGVFCEHNSNPKIINTTIVNNSAQYGGGISCFDSGNPFLINSILWSNSPQEIFFINNNLFEDNALNSVALAYCNIQGGPGNIEMNQNGFVMLFDGTTNIDPLFVDEGSNNFNLTENSPCIDAGTSLFFWNDSYMLDLDDNDYSGSAPDMGAFEFNNPTDMVKREITHNRNFSYNLLQNYPNPFNASTTIQFTIAKSVPTNLKIYNILGKEVETLINEELPMGEYKIKWKPVNLPSGIYLCRLNAGEFIDTKKIILQK